LLIEGAANKSKNASEDILDPDIAEAASPES